METTFGGVNGEGLNVSEGNSLGDSRLAYPNPTSGLLHVSCSSSAMSQLEIHDALGSLLLSVSGENQRAVLDLKSLATGVYFLTILSTDGTQSTARIVKQ